MEPQAAVDSLVASVAVAVVSLAALVGVATLKAVEVVARKEEVLGNAAVLGSVQRVVREAVGVAGSNRVDDRGPSLVYDFAINCFQTERGHRFVSHWYQS